MATILCIDDDAGILEMYKAVLEVRAHMVITAPDGTSGIALSRKHAVDAVVLDFNMPGLNGDEVAAVLMKEQPTLPVVICSGSADLPESLKWFAGTSVWKGDGIGALLAAIDSSLLSVTQPKDRLVG